MNEQRAKRLIELGVKMALARGHLASPPDDGRYQTMLVELVEGGPRFRMMLAKRTADEVLNFSRGKVTAERIQATMTRRDHFPLLSAVVDGEDMYSEITEMRVDVNQVGTAKPFQVG